MSIPAPTERQAAILRRLIESLTGDIGYDTPYSLLRAYSESLKAADIEPAPNIHISSAVAINKFDPRVHGLS